MSHKQGEAPDRRTLQQRIDAAADVLTQAIVAGIADIRRETPQAPPRENGKTFFQATAHSNYVKTKRVKKKLQKKDCCHYRYESRFVFEPEQRLDTEK